MLLYLNKVKFLTAEAQKKIPNDQLAISNDQ